MNICVVQNTRQQYVFMAPLTKQVINVYQHECKQNKPHQFLEKASNLTLRNKKSVKYVLNRNNDSKDVKGASGEFHQIPCYPNLKPNAPKLKHLSDVYN